jgi:hypothetical protein
MSLASRIKCRQLKVDVCYYCGIKIFLRSHNEHNRPDSASLDHRVPRSRGGKSKGNLVLCCYKCNATKGSMTEQEFRSRFGYQIAVSSKSEKKLTKKELFALYPGSPEQRIHPSPIWHKKLRRQIKKLVSRVKETKVLKIPTANRASRWFTKDFMELFGGD